MNWKIALVATTLATIGALAVAGCGGDDCTRADDHLAECAAATASNNNTGSTTEAPVEPCSGARICQSQCINQHTCTQITGNDPGYIACLTGCLGK